MGGRSSREGNWRRSSSSTNQYTSSSSSYEYPPQSSSYNSQPLPQPAYPHQYYPPPPQPQQQKKKLDRRYSRIADNYNSLDQVPITHTQYLYLSPYTILIICAFNILHCSLVSPLWWLYIHLYLLGESERLLSSSKMFKLFSLLVWVTANEF